MIRYRCILVANSGTTRATVAAVAAVATSTAADTGSAILTFCDHSAALDSNDTAIAASTAISAVTASAAAASTARRTAVHSLISICSTPPTHSVSLRTTAAVYADFTILAIAATAAADTCAALTTNSIHCTGIYSDGACIRCGLTVKSTLTANALCASGALNVGYIPCTIRASTSICAIRAAHVGVSLSCRAADTRAAVATGDRQRTGTGIPRSAVNGQRGGFRYKDTGGLAAVGSIHRRCGTGQEIGRVVLHHKGDLRAIRQFDGRGCRCDGHAVQHQHNFTLRSNLHRVLASSADLVSAGSCDRVRIIGQIRCAADIH